MTTNNYLFNDLSVDEMQTIAGGEIITACAIVGLFIASAAFGFSVGCYALR